MKTVAMLYLCTGAYVYFWEEFFKSFEEKFLPNTEKHYFVWTDSDNIFAEDNKRVHKIYKECLGFPDETLKRFHTFSTITDKLESFDYFFFMNSNSVCIETITEEEFIPNDDELLVVKHPGYLNTFVKFLPYERREESTAFIAFDEGKYYVLGGVNGGPSAIYLKMIHTLKENIDKDLENNIVAVWHDESHLNKYITNSEVKFKVLDSDYGFFEDWYMPFLTERIRILEKRKYIDMTNIK